MRRRGAAALAAALLAAAVASAPTPRVDRFSPTGDVAGPEQITLHFTTTMVAMGDPRLPAPVAGNCSKGATGRWVDTQNYAIDLPAPLPGGQRCVYELVAGLKDARGAAVTGERRFVFTTGGPAIRAMLPDSGRIAEDQIFLMALGAPPTAASVAAHAACLIEGVGEAVPLDLLPDTTRDTLLAGLAKDYSLRYFLERAGWRKPDYGDDATPSRATIVAAKCRRSLPAGGKLTLDWGRDVAASNGLVTGEARRLAYDVRPAFTARFECARVNAGAACSPLEALRVAFTGDVPAAQALAVRLVGADGKAIAPESPKGRAVTLGSISFKGPFAERSRFRVTLPAGLADDGGRRLANAARFPLDVATGDYPPLIKFAGSFGIIEAAEGGVLPITLRGVEARLAARASHFSGRALPVATDAEVARWLRILDGAEDRTTIELPIAGSDETKRIETTRSAPLIAATVAARGFRIARGGQTRTMEVVGIPLARGFHVVEVASPALGAALLGPYPPGQPRTRYVATGALVTDMAVHFQWGRGASLAWVTRLADAAPVSGAAVTISDSCTGRLLWQGRTDASGRARVPDRLPPPASYTDCRVGSEAGSEHALLVSARTADDYSFTLTSWGNGIQGSDFNLPQGYGYDPQAFHAVFDRTLLRAGETVNLKLFARTRNDSGIAAGPRLTAPSLTIRHLGSGATFTTPFAARGDSGTASWAIPKTAALGEYAVEIAPAPGDEARVAGSFRVEEFRLPTSRASVTGPRTPQVAPTAVPVDLALTYLSGGAVARAPVKLRTIVEPRSVTVPGYDGWSFAGEALRPGVVPLDGDNEDAETASRAPLRARIEPVALGAKGVARVIVGGLTPVTEPSRLVAEMDYDDANGEVATTSARIDLDPASLRVGIRRDGWLAKSDDLRLNFVVLDLAGKPVRGQRVSVKLFSRETYSYRKRLVGGFYAYDNSRETKELGASCRPTTDALGRAACALDPGVSGEVVAMAEVSDAAGRTTRATMSVWLAGDDDWWFGGDNGDRMDVVPETPQVAANGTARLQVRMPFRSATALVTVLRDGVIDSFVTPLSGKDPVVEVKMRGSYAPNVYVSVLAVRGRVAGWRLWLADLARRWHLPWLSREAAYPTALIDLAKPSYRLGMAKLEVGQDWHRLGVKVASDRPSYAIRSAANARVSVTAPAGRTLPRDAEIAFAAVDEALLQLAPNASWDVLASLMSERPLAVVMATAQTQVVGKRHYGAKAVAAGGGGGASAGLARRDFQPLLLWRGRVPLDSRGEAAIPFRLNDSLSGFRLVAVASAGADLFGTGSAAIRTTQDLQLLAGIPPAVRDGDDYVATVLARNTTTAPMTVRLTGSAGAITLPPLARTIPAGGAATAAWRIVAPASGPVAWRVAARAASGAADTVEVAQTVLPAVPDQILQAALVQAGATLPMALPAGAIRGRGGVDIAVSRSLGGALPGVRAYMAAYPYDCIEQRTSKAVALGDRAAWDAAMAALPTYLDANGLARFFPGDWLDGSPELTAYLFKLSAASGWPLPPASASAMRAGIERLLAGRSTARLDDGRKVAALAGLAAAGAATPALAQSIAIAPDDWSSAILLDWIDVLVAVPTLPERDARLAKAEAVLRARLDLQGTTLRVARGADGWQLLASRDSIAAALVRLATTRAGWRGDGPRLARALMLGQRQGHWDTTPANAMGTLAMRDFARVFEAGPVTGATEASLAGVARRFVWSGEPAAQSLPWPAAAAPLTIAHQGSGAPWVTVTARAALPLPAPLSSGFALSRRVTPVSQAVPGRWSRGDVMRVTLTVTARAPVEWVAINDPVPAGATILGGGLGGRSQLLAGDEGGGGTPPSFVERRSDAVHAHYAALGRAPVTYDYTLRLGSTGTFRLPPTRVEALYSPEMLALLPNAAVVVAAAK